MNFMRYPNVVGVGRGNKYINNVDTGNLCIQVYVKEKYKKGCNGEGCVPKYYFGIPTDVIETGEFTSRRGFSDKIRPAKMGYSIAPTIQPWNYGTAGCIVKKDTPSGNIDLFILACNHTMADINRLPIGTAILQPSDISEPLNIIAKLSKFEEIKVVTPQSMPENYIDAAIAKITDINLVRPNIAFIGIPRGIKQNVVLGTIVKKSGRTTGYTTGKVIADNVSEIVNQRPGIEAFYVDQILLDIEEDWGDSGSMILTEDNNVVGMLIAGSKLRAAMSKIQNIVNILDVSLYTQS